MHICEILKEAHRGTLLRVVILLFLFAPTRCELSMTDRNNSTRMFNYTANINAQQVNNARSKGSGSLIGNMSCTTRVINITDVIIPCCCTIFRNKFLLLQCVYVMSHPQWEIETKWK